MKMYIECEKGFYDFSGCAFERICQELNTNSLIIYANRKTDKRDFEIGARVYFENVGWTEVARHEGCDSCVFQDANCGDMYCADCVRSDCNDIIYKKLNLVTSENEKLKGNFFDTMPAPEGLKFDSGKLRPGLIPPEVIRAVAEVMTYGAKKYSADNWKQVDPERYIDALWRHYLAWKTGEEKDAESGLSHVAHFATNALFLLYFELEKEKKQNENR